MLRSTYKKEYQRKAKQLDEAKAKKEIARVKTLDKDTIFQHNMEFEAVLYESCADKLTGFGKKFYAEQVLNAMWNGEYYDWKKRPWHYTIPARYTTDKADFVVALPEVAEDE